MPKTARTKVSSDTKDSRMAEAQSFTSGDRVRHKVNGRLGIFLEINLGFALPEVWVQFESDTECSVPVSCNPLELELVNIESNQHSELPSVSELSEAEDTSVTAVSLGELTEEEASSRYRLELKVERAFYEAGCALRELRDRRLYRSTHKKFEDYCRDRFGFTHRHVNYLIAASQVFENLLVGTISSQTSDIQMGTNSSQILPTSETQVRPLASLEPDKQRELWHMAVEEAGGSVPTARIVKGIVERLKERGTTPPPVPYQVGDVVEIRAGCNPTLRKHDGCWGIVIYVGTFSCKVHISLRSVNVQCKPDEMDSVDPKYTLDIRVVHQRITALSELDLDPVIWSMLETLSRQTCFTQIQLNSLAWAEQQYGISTL